MADVDAALVQQILDVAERKGKEECQKLLSPQIGDTMVVLSGVPFGQIGSTNNIRVATFR